MITIRAYGTVRSEVMTPDELYHRIGYLEGMVYCIECGGAEMDLSDYRKEIEDLKEELRVRWIVGWRKFVDDGEEKSKA